MKKLSKKLILLGLVASMGTTMVACGDKEEPKEDVVVEQEAEETEEHTHLLPFEWTAVADFKDGEYTAKFKKNEGEGTVNIGFLKVTDGEDFHDVEHHGIHMMDHESKKDHFHLGEHFHAEHEYAYEIDTEGETGEVKFEIKEGSYHVFFEHLPEEFDFEIVDAEGEKVEFRDAKTYEAGSELE